MKSLKLASILATALAAVAATSLALAAAPSATVSWTAPTTYTDGTALAAADLASYTVIACRGASACVSFTTAAVAAGTAPPTSLAVPLTCGNYTFTVAAETTAAAKYPTISSVPSAAVPYATGVSCAPNPPSGVVVVATPGAG